MSVAGKQEKMNYDLMSSLAPVTDSNLLTANIGEHSLVLLLSSLAPHSACTRMRSYVSGSSTQRGYGNLSSVSTPERGKYDVEGNAQDINYMYMQAIKVEIFQSMTAHLFKCNHLLKDNPYTCSFIVICYDHPPT